MVWIPSVASALTPASPEAARIADLFWWMAGGAVVIRIGINADDGGTRSAFSSPVRVRLLGIPDWQPVPLWIDFLRRGARWRLVHVPAADASYQPGIGPDIWLLGFST
jgi:hypothetical protein